MRQYLFIIAAAICASVLYSFGQSVAIPNRPATGGGAFDTNGNYTNNGNWVFNGTNNLNGYTTASNLYVFNLFVTNGDTNIMAGYLADWYSINPAITNNYYTKTESSNVFQLISGMTNYYTQASVNSLLDGKASKNTMFAGVGTTGLITSANALNDTKFLRGDGQWADAGGTNGGSSGLMADGAKVMFNTDFYVSDNIVYNPTNNIRTNIVAYNWSCYGSYGVTPVSFNPQTLAGGVGTATGYRVSASGSYLISCDAELLVPAGRSGTIKFELIQSTSTNTGTNLVLSSFPVQVYNVYNFASNGTAYYDRYHFSGIVPMASNQCFAVRIITSGHTNIAQPQVGRLIIYQISGASITDIID